MAGERHLQGGVGPGRQPRPNVSPAIGTPTHQGRSASIVRAAGPYEQSAPTDSPEVPTMANKPPNPQVRIHDGRPVVNRDWIVEYTGASRVTAALWYSKRNEVPDVATGADGQGEQFARHPEKAV